MGSPHDMHHEENASVEANSRLMSTTERHQLNEASQEFILGATLASLQDCDISRKMVWEVCCRLDSSLANECLARGLHAKRKTIETGYDLEKKSILERLKVEASRERPRRAWFSLKCTEWTNIQNLNQRNEKQIEALRKRRQKARKMARNGLDLVAFMVEDIEDFHFYWEWPKTAFSGWNLQEMKDFEEKMKKRGVNLYWTEIHGCMFGMRAPEGDFINKPWLILSNDANFHYRCWTACDRSHQHRVGGMVGIGSRAVEATGYYPVTIVKMIVKCWIAQTEQSNRKQQHPDLYPELYGLDNLAQEVPGDESMKEESKVEEHVGPQERERAQALLHRLHKAAGHPTNRALARLVKDRNLPRWMVQMALDLKCQACIDTQRGEQMIIPYSLGAKPSPWQVVAIDVMDMVFPAHRCKARFLIMTDMVMKFTSIKMTWKGTVGEAGTDSGRVLVNAFVDGWLLHRPRPQWVLVDPQTSLEAGHFVEFLHLAGVGVSVTPGEAHWQAGTIESIIKVVKNTMRRLRNQHPELDPETCAGLAVNSHNTQYKVKGFSPTQWAYGTNINDDDANIGPLEYNAHQPHVPYKFWATHRLRQQAEETWRKEQASEAWTRLKNAAPRRPREFQVGQWVCIWRTAIWRSRKKSLNPEPRYVGPGRIAMIEPAILSENKPAVYWVLMGTQVWRCAPEQIRLATEQEVTIEELQKGKTVHVPVTDLLKGASKVVDVLKEPGYPTDSSDLPDEPGPRGQGALQDPALARAQPFQAWEDNVQDMEDTWQTRRKRDRTPDDADAERAPTVRQERWRWTQLISVNENRRREGLPPVMELPPLPFEPSDDDLFVKTEYFDLDGQKDTTITEESYSIIMSKIAELEETAKAVNEKNRLREEIRRQAKEEEELCLGFLEACDRQEEVCEMVVEIDDWKEFLNSGIIYTKQMMSNAKEINFKNLNEQHRKLVQEAMARELSEVLKSHALRTVKEKVSPEILQSRNIPMRWLLTWKTLDEFCDPAKESYPTVVREDGWAKAKARIVLIGYKHPDLAKRDPRTGKNLLQTSAPTLSRMGRNLLLQAGALDQHLLESADAKSAFLQASHGIGTKQLYTTAVDEISHALGVPRGTSLEIVGAIYGLTNAPRVFWLDADEKLTNIGGQSHGIDKCIWVFKNRHGKVCGRVGSHVDDFLILGDPYDEDWKIYRKKILDMYSWSPWKKGQFVFAGVQLQRLQDHTILLHQEQFCNELKPVVIENERLRPKDDKLTTKELSQCRGLIMKAQWRAIQSAPQYCCRIGLAASALVKGTLDTLKEANAIVKELKKSSKDGLIFHSFHGENLNWQQVIFLHFGDAARGNRVDGSDTGGFITGIASPAILSGKEARMSVVDYKSFKLERPVRGSNGSEGQALYVTEDQGWKSRVFWSILYGNALIRGNADSLSSMVESLLIMDSRGCFDSLSNSDSPLLGMNNAKTGVELRSVQHGLREGSNCFPTWCPSDMNISDVMTKVSYDSFRVWALWQSRRAWIVKFNDEFISARKQQKLRQQQGKTKHALMDPIEQPDLEELDWPTRHN